MSAQSPVPSAQPAEGTALWVELSGELLRTGSGSEHPDAVQETLLRLLRRLGAAPEALDATRLARCILRGIRIDQLRGHRAIQLGDADEQVAQPPTPSSTTKYPDLTEHLGAAAAELLGAILSGVRSNKALARQLDTSPCSIRKRRKRLRRLLGRMLAASIDAAEDPPRSVS